MPCSIRLLTFLFLLLLVLDIQAQVPGERNLSAAELLISQHKYDSALELLNAELDHLSDNDSSVFRANLHRLKDKALWGENQKAGALAEAELAYRLFVRNLDKRMAAEMALRMGLNYLIVGNYPLGLQRAQEASEMYTALKDSLNMLVALTRISIAHHDLGNYDLGIQYGKRAIALQATLMDAGPNEFLEAYTVTAINFDDRGDQDSAIFYHRKILDIIHDVTRETRVPLVYNNLGNSLLKKGELAEALKLFETNLKINRELGKKSPRYYDMATVLTNLGTVNYKLGNYAAASQYLDSADYYAHKSGDVEKMYDVYYQKFLFNDLIDNDQTAIDYLLRYNQLRDSLQDVETKAAMALIEVQYATKEKENQIALQRASLENQRAEIRLNYILLSLALAIIILLVIIFVQLRHRSRRKQELLLREKDIELREAQIKSAIASQESERNRFARDLHDSFGQLISTLNFNLKALEEEHNKNPEARNRVFENCSMVITSMYNELRSICFDLMPQTLIMYGLPAALKEFATRINETGKRYVQVDSFGLNKRLSEIQEISLFRIAQEWTNNILKHGDGNKISIQVIREAGNIILTIEDNGSGFDAGKLTKSTGNGWKNIQTRTKLVKGEMNLETRPGKRYNTLMIEIPAVEISTDTVSVEESKLA